MAREIVTSLDEQNKDIDIKDMCVTSYAQERLERHFDSPIEEYGSILFFLCKECKEMIDDMESNQIG